jgi:epoxyqueuosine reductase QueG
MFLPHGVEYFGVCAYADALPLLEVRGKGRVPAGAKSVICCLFPWYTGEFSPRNVARYAVPDDYHRVCGGILEAVTAALRERHPMEEFVWFVDSSPIREVDAAQLAGLGVAGLHGQLLHPEYGSRVFLGEIVTTLDLPPSAPTKGVCLRCGKCVAACPTGALTENGLDKARCRSAVTQKKAALTDWEQEQVIAGGLVWGCDICSDACPLNRDKPTPIRAFYENPVPLVTEENLDHLLTEKSYGWRGRGVLERNLGLVQP